MCGIAGIIDHKGSFDRSRCEKMSSRLFDRRPDQSGMYFEGAASLIHRRLAIIDIENSRQPMSAIWGNENYTIVYNGELYNTQEIKKELIMLGHAFRTDGDTEVVLHAYIEWGEGSLDKFNGIFAFAVWESKAEKLFFARDPMGVKPFFYSLKDGVFLFASSVPTLLESGVIEPVIDKNSIFEIMLVGPGRTPGCAVFPDICELPRGCCGTFSNGHLETHEYFILKDHPHTDTFAETVSKVRELVFDAIERQMVSDVPIGTFLSGGLDSSVISALVAQKMREKGKTLDTFSVFYRDNEKYFKPGHFQPNSDDRYIELMAAHIGSNHHEVILDTPALVDALFDAIDARGLPSMADVDSSLLLFCKEIKKHVSVALSGECADEIFGGYPWYRDKDIRDKEGFPWAQSTSYRASFLLPELKADASPEEFIASRYIEAKRRADKRHDLSPLEARMREMMMLNLDHFMQTLLFRKDAMSMYSSLEVRVPFCDKRITEYLYSTPWEFKDYEGREKGLLRLATQELLPEEVAWRKKSPYPKTHNPAYLSALRSLLSDLLSDPSAPLWAICEKGAVSSLLTTERSVPWYGQLMTTPQTIAYLLQINYWMKKFGVKIKF